MKNLVKLTSLIILVSWATISSAQTGAIRLNQLGYYPEANKIALVVFTKATTFEVVKVSDGSIALSGDLSANLYWSDAGDSIKICDFSELTHAGTYKIRIPEFGESYPFEISNTVLRKVAYASLKSFYYQRCSFELTEPYAGLWDRKAGHPDTVCILHASTGQTGQISSPGGWYDAGDFGKYVINAGISVANLLSFHENFNGFYADSTINIPESGNGKNDLLDEVKFELDWLKTMQDSDGGVFFKLTTLNFAGFIMPEKASAARYVIGKTTASALDFAAMMAMAGRIYQNYDSAYAADCKVRAESAWVWAKANPEIYFKNPSDVNTGEYGDGNVSDEFVWAAAELFITTKNEEYKTYLEAHSDLLKYTKAPGWPSVNPLASLSLATQTNGLSDELITTIQTSITSTADGWLNQIEESPCRIPKFGYNWGSNSGVANIGVGLLYAYIITNNTKYIKGAAECADYLLGKNATGFSFVTSYGYNTPMNIHHRASGADGIIQPVPGFVAGGPNSGRQDKLNYPFSAPAKSYVDVTDSYASNEICINWNAPLTALLAGVDAILGDGSSVNFETPVEVNNPPALTINYPKSNSNIDTTQQLLAKCTPSDADGILRVEVYIDSRYAGQMSDTPFELTLNAFPIGEHTATFIAYDVDYLATSKTNIFNYVLPSSIEKAAINQNTLQISPNPFSGSFVVKYHASDFSPINFTLFDVNGNKIDELKRQNTQLLDGQFDWKLDSEMAVGVYFIKMQQKDKIISRKVIKTE